MSPKRKSIRSLSTEGKSKKAKTVKSLPSLPQHQDQPLPLKSSSTKTPTEREEILTDWKAENDIGRILHEERIQDTNLARMKQLLDWYIEGHSIQADSYDQLDAIKFLISRNYRLGDNGEWILTTNLEQWEEQVNLTSSSTTPSMREIPNPFLHEWNPFNDTEDSLSRNQISDTSGSEDPATGNLKSPKGKRKPEMESVKSPKSTKLDAILNKKDKSSVTEESSTEDKSNGSLDPELREDSSSSVESTPEKAPVKYMAIKEQILLEPLCREGATVTEQNMTDFIDRLQRAVANMQPIPQWSALIPGNVFNAINVKLHGMRKPQLSDGTFIENINNLKALYTKESEKKNLMTPEEALARYLNDLIKFFKEFKYPIILNVTDLYMEFVQKTLTRYGIPGYPDYFAIDERKSKPFLVAIMKFYQEKQVNYQFYGILYSYLMGYHTGILPRDYASCNTIATFCLKLSSFF